MQWYAMSNNEKSNIPEWARSFGINDKGVVFAPASMAKTPEKEVYLCTHFDGTPSAIHKDHYYVPTSWLSKEFPETAELCALIEKEASGSHANNIL